MGGLGPADFPRCSAVLLDKQLFQFNDGGELPGSDAVRGVARKLDGIPEDGDQT